MILASYLENIEKDSLTIETLQHHKVFVYQDDGQQPTKEWSIYNCLVFETSHGGGQFVLTAGEWFEVDRSFTNGVDRVLHRIPNSDVPLPNIRTDADGSLESEPIYNLRVAQEDHSMALLDRKTARCLGTTTGIEVCDLPSEDEKTKASTHNRLFVLANAACDVYFAGKR